MLTINIHDSLTSRMHDLASAYSETEYLAQSAINKERLDKAVKDIQSGKYEAHGLLND